jgi:hypothetical protein
MKRSSEFTIQKFTSTSRRIYFLSIVLFFLAGAIGILLQSLSLKWKWFGVISIVLLIASVLLLAISWITPGILIISRAPWLAHAWLRGINTTIVWDKPWEQLSGFQKFLIYFWSLLLSGFTLLAIVGFILQAIRG